MTRLVNNRALSIALRIAALVVVVWALRGIFAMGAPGAWGFSLPTTPDQHSARYPVSSGILPRIEPAVTAGEPQEVRYVITRYGAGWPVEIYLPEGDGPYPVVVFFDEDQLGVGRIVGNPMMLWPKVIQRGRALVVPHNRALANASPPDRDCSQVDGDALGFYQRHAADDLQQVLAFLRASEQFRMDDVVVVGKGLAGLLALNVVPGQADVRALLSVEPVACRASYGMIPADGLREIEQEFVYGEGETSRVPTRFAFSSRQQMPSEADIWALRDSYCGDNAECSKASLLDCPEGNRNTESWADAVQRFLVDYR